MAYLDGGIVDRIVTFCPTFNTLQSTILVSKTPIACFKRARNFITVDEQGKLQETSRVVAALEDVYSVTNKGCTSKISVLTPDESWRFRWAMYRIMLYCNQFQGSRYMQYDDDCIEGIESAATHGRTYSDSIQRTSSCSCTLSFVEFLRNIFVILGVFVPSSHNPNVIEVLLSTRPPGSLRSWEARNFGVLGDDINFTLFEDDDRGSLTADHVAPPQEDARVEMDLGSSQRILDQVHGANDTCSRCAHPGGLNLETETNWHCFPIFLINLLKGNLKRTSTITQPFFVATSHFANADALGPFIEGLFALTAQTAPAFDGWGRKDSCGGLRKEIGVQLELPHTDKQSHADLKNDLCDGLFDFAEMMSFRAAGAGSLPR
ncbi:hypothetical protein DFH08DRAFT_823288 [Mycena albidolilacea]|uniref:Uncharacterized protein n=1 Tax=Mycena albidolilacea TaxID=1033008 RepID=A0AAD7EC95_9AGAR|nr:hypothetical protein DFH08DRAFT_823288 [Mycena albidolilacea]